MTPEQVDRILGEVFSLAHVAAGAVITWFVALQTTKRADRKKARKALGSIQFTIISENVVNRYLLHLKRLKDFYAENYDLMSKHAFNLEFFREWLQHPFIGHEEQIQDPTWTKEKVAKLQNDVMKLKL